MTAVLPFVLTPCAATSFSGPPAQISGNTEDVLNVPPQAKHATPPELMVKLDRGPCGSGILAGSIVERFARKANGELMPWQEGQPVAETWTHAGIVKVDRYSFSI